MNQFSKFKEGDVVTYVGSDDEWNHECCKGARYRIVNVHPPVLGIFYYDLVAVDEWDPPRDSFFPEINSVREYQLQLNAEKITEE